MCVPYSHTDKELETHTKEVCKRAGELCNSKEISKLTRIVGLSHDIGKATKWFQKDLMGDSISKSEKWTYHSQIGALAAYYIVNQNENMDEKHSILAYITVSSHHSGLPNVKKYIDKKRVHSLADENRQERIRNQINNMDEKYHEFCENIFENTNCEWSEFLDFIDTEFYDSICKSMKKMDEKDFYPKLLKTWSSLILADKTSAADLSKSDYIGHTLPEKRKLDNHIKNLEDPEEDIKIELNKLREKARKDIIEKSKEDTSNLTKISLPTGFGKTYTGLSYSLRKADRRDSRVIYALPFTSIIDQVDEKMKEIFNLSINSDKYTIHNHLSETVNKFDDNTDEYSKEEYMIGESWKSGFILTTFTQLFESLSSPNNQQSMKIPRLDDSVIILDEPQAISLEWWNIIRNHIIPLLTEEYNCEVILMTATQPSILDEGEQLIKNKDRYFEFLEKNNRVKYEIHNSLYNYVNNEAGKDYISYSEAANIIHKQDCSTMSICNTIDSSEKLYKELSEKSDYINLNKVYCRESEEKIYNGLEKNVVDKILKSEKEVIAFLSSRIRPKDREKLIDCITEILGEKQVKLVTTQLVEAGVDISFERVYRDFCPIPSIVQAAGRCNRSYGKNKGEVTIWMLKEEDSKPPCHYVYSMGSEENLLKITREVLKKEDNIEEKRMIKDLVEKYYEKLRDKEPGKKELSNKVNNLEFKDLNKESFIDNRNRQSVDIIVCRTEEEKEKAKNIINKEDYSNIVSLVNEMKSERVSIRYNSEKEIKNLIRHCDEIRYMDNLYILKNDKCIDKVLGTKIPESSVEGRFVS